jgi:purine-cytosine permease-like protein
MTEFEREPVPPERLKSFGSLVSLYAGEHVAGTEFMIGPLFLAAGVSAFDLLVGLLVGNILAVLSWTFVCAPVAVSERLTLYFKLEKICGPGLVKIYNVANGLLFCILAGAMVSVSATAVGLPFSMSMPSLGDILPNSIGWVVAVVFIGTAFGIVAAKGYDAMAKVASLSAPWMALVFLACGIVALPSLGIHSVRDFWAVANRRIWTGGTPMAGQTKFTIWHVIFFAWFCNAAMHLGMADMSIFRYARRWQHGVSSAAGMFLGHYLAWIAASLLFAVQLSTDPSNTQVAPGPMAYNAVGITGLICVVIAGWTTANPTIYRAGLAFQAIVPRSSRFGVTLVAGGVATVGASLSLNAIFFPPWVWRRNLPVVKVSGSVLRRVLHGSAPLLSAEHSMLSPAFRFTFWPSRGGSRRGCCI